MGSFQSEEEKPPPPVQKPPPTRAARSVADFVATSQENNWIHIERMYESEPRPGLTNLCICGAPTTSRQSFCSTCRALIEEPQRRSNPPNPTVNPSRTEPRPSSYYSGWVEQERPNQNQYHNPPRRDQDGPKAPQDTRGFLDKRNPKPPRACFVCQSPDHLKRDCLQSYANRSRSRQTNPKQTNPKQATISKGGPRSPSTVPSPSNFDSSKNECKICYDQDIGTVFVPCGHMACCVDCSKHFDGRKGCPICKTPIERVQKIYGT